MRDLDNIYVDGGWAPSASSARIAVRNPATDAVIGRAPAGCSADVAEAVAAARRAFGAWSALEPETRLRFLGDLRAGLAARADEIAELISAQMGTPIGFSRAAQLGLPLRNLDATMTAMAALTDETIGRSRVRRLPVGVVAAITPWNFPLHQIIAKVAPALAAGCTVVLKPSEITPFDAAVVAEVADDIGLPAGVLNLVFGAAETGEELVAHAGIDMVSFTGSTRAGRRIAEVAGRDLKKLALELGGKSANILLDDVDLEDVVPKALGQCFVNAGQTCAALTRLLVPASLVDEVERLVIAVAGRLRIGDPLDPGVDIGPLATRAQQARVRAFIDEALDAGARLLVGGSGQPDGLPVGAYVQPTVLTDVGEDWRIVREEVFGPVLVILPYENEDDAVRLANDSVYGLSGGVWSADPTRADAIARRLRTGQVIINGAMLDLEAPFGGVGQSGLGREYGRYGLEEFFSVQAITGAPDRS